jgi:hypothetical protein
MVVRFFGGWESRPMTRARGCRLEGYAKGVPMG